MFEIRIYNDSTAFYAWLSPSGIILSPIGSAQAIGLNTVKINGETFRVEIPGKVGT